VKRAVILLSGGLDSATTLAIAKAEGFACYALSFRYGQRHEVELDAAARVAKHLGAKEHRILDFDLRQFGGSALTSDIAGSYAVDMRRADVTARVDKRRELAAWR